MDAINWFIPHQASKLAMHHVRKNLRIPGEKFVDIYATHGNQMAASIPTVLYSLIESKKLQRGHPLRTMEGRRPRCVVRDRLRFL